MRPWIQGALLLYGFLGLAQALQLIDLGAWSQGAPDLCLFHRVTGFDCPGCGMGRALILLLQGRVQASWAMHPFAIFFLLWMLLWALLPEDVLGRFSRSQNPVLKAAPILALVLLLLRWVWHLAYPA